MKIKILILFTIIGLTLKAQNEEKKMDTLSYSVGVLLAKNLKSQGFDKLDAASVAKAVTDVIEGKELAVSIPEAQNLVNSYATEKAMKMSAAVKETGEAFLAENKMREGVMTTESGLQYEVLEAGEGPSPGPNNKVTVHYHGTLIDGTVFDSSVERDEVMSFQVNQVIMGWQEALQLMKVGDKWRVYIPYDLAYGERGAGKKIPPYSALIFEVQLFGIE